MSVIDQKTLFSQALENEVADSKNDTYTPEEMELEGVDMQTNSSDREVYIESLKFQTAMLDMFRYSIKNDKVHKSFLNIVAFAVLTFVNAVLIVLGVICVGFTRNFMPVSEKRKS